MRAVGLMLTISLAAAGASMARAGDANGLRERCRAVAHANHGGTPGSTYKQLGPHQFRMRELCAAWDALAASDSAGKSEPANALADRCVREARFDLARANEPAYERHVKAGVEMCRDYRTQALQAR